MVLTEDDTGLAVESAGHRTVVPARARRTGLAVRVVVDRGAIEARTGDGRWVALRIPHLHVRTVILRGGGRLDAWRLDAVQLR